MTTEKMYQNILEMVKAYDVATGNNLLSEIEKDPFTWANNKYFPFYAIAADMLIDCRATMDKKSTSGKSMTAIKRMCKSAMESRNPALSGIFQYDGKYIICDGYRIIRMNHDIESLPHIPENVLPIDATKIMKPAIDGCNSEVTLPEVSELKAYIAKCKAIGGKNHRLAYELSGRFVNPEYLLDMIQAIPDCKCFVNADKGWRSEMYFVNETEETDGLLLPVNPNNVKTA